MVNTVKLRSGLNSLVGKFKPPILKKIMILILWAGFALALPPLYLYPTNSTSAVDSTFTISVNIDHVIGLSSCLHGLYGYQFWVSCDPNILAIIGASLENTWFDLTGGYQVWNMVIDSIAGDVKVMVTRPLGSTTGLGGSGMLLFITYQVKQTGISFLTLSHVKLVCPAPDTIPCEIKNGFFSSLGKPR